MAQQKYRVREKIYLSTNYIIHGKYQARMGAVSFARQSEEVLLGCFNPMWVIEKGHVTAIIIDYDTPIIYNILRYTNVR